MSDGQKMNSKFWVPIMIMALFSVASITSAAYLGAARSQAVKDRDRLEVRIEAQESGARDRESRLAKLEVVLPMVLELTRENNEMLKKHMGIR